MGLGMLGEIDEEARKDFDAMNAVGNPIESATEWYWQPQVVFPLWLAPISLLAAIYFRYRDTNAPSPRADLEDDVESGGAYVPIRQKPFFGMGGGASSLVFSVSSGSGGGGGGGLTQPQYI